MQHKAKKSFKPLKPQPTEKLTAWKNLQTTFFSRTSFPLAAS